MNFIVSANMVILDTLSEKPLSRGCNSAAGKRAKPKRAQEE
jgi:hypothetical protein